MCVCVCVHVCARACMRVCMCACMQVTNAQGQENEVSAEDVEKVVEDLSRFH